MQIKIVCFEMLILVRVIAPQLTNKTHQVPQMGMKNRTD